MSAADEIFEVFEIEFDAGPEPVFHGGELMTGSLRVNLKKRITINAIRLQFKGRSCWVADSLKHAIKGEKEKIYFDKDLVLLERPPGHPEPGHFPWNANFLYSLPFECPLPKGCPTSYESPFAYIRYYARCTIETDESSKFLVKKAFTVLAPPDLRQLVPPPEEPISLRDVATFGGCCCRGKISAELALRKHTYAPGENVFATLSIDNRNLRYAEQIVVRLVDRPKQAVELPPSDTTLTESITLPNESTATANADLANGVAVNGVSIQTNAKKEKKAAKKRVVKKYQKSDAPLVTSHVKSKHGEGQHRVLFARTLAKEDIIQSKESASQSELFLLTIPSVPTSILPDSSEADVNEQLSSLTSTAVADGRLSKLLESPSTATFRLRRQPFIRIEYALQVSIGAHLLIEVPIEIHPIPIYANGIDFQPFAAGPQPIAEADESDCKTFHGPFTFTPRYSIYLTPPKPIQVLNSNVVTTSNIEQVPDNVDKNIADMKPVARVTTTINRSTVELPDGSKLIDHKRQQITTCVITTTKHMEEPSIAPKEHENPGVIEQQSIVQHEHVLSPNANEHHHNLTQPTNVGAQFNEEQTSHNQDSVQLNENQTNDILSENKDGEPKPTEQVLSNDNHSDENGVEEHHSNCIITHEESNKNTNVVEQRKTEEHLENGHIVQTTTITRTTNGENGDNENSNELKSSRIVETTVEEVEYDENGIEVRKLKSTVNSKQQRTIETHEANEPITVE